jgi:hypothetical protein
VKNCRSFAGQGSSPFLDDELGRRNLRLLLASGFVEHHKCVVCFIRRTAKRYLLDLCSRPPAPNFVASKVTQAIFITGRDRAATMTVDQRGRSVRPRSGRLLHRNTNGVYFALLIDLNLPIIFRFDIEPTDRCSFERA